MATTQETLSFRRLALQIALVLVVLLVALSDFGNPIFAAVGFASGLLLVLVAVDAIREHPLYPMAFGLTIALSGVAAVVVHGEIGLFAVLLVLGGLGILGEWGYRRYDS